MVTRARAISLETVRPDPGFPLSQRIMRQAARRPRQCLGPRYWWGMHV